MIYFLAGLIVLVCVWLTAAGKAIAADACTGDG
jgi:hypothetical protein